MTNINILKIETNNKVVLLSRNAKQEIFPASKADIVRNINAVPLQRKNCVKLRTVIETGDTPDVSAFAKNAVFRIYSITNFSQSDKIPKPKEFVDGSLECCDGYVTFRPIFNALLTNFACKTDSSGTQIWKLEFEEV
ncbi:MAG: hypothetical protein IJT13_00040 [Bacteroidaceae bacterium]|nr:hypothetical protein [Bacteroidaceae bacterium]